MLAACIWAPFWLHFGTNYEPPCAEDRNAEIDDLYGTLGGSSASKTSLFGADFGVKFLLFSHTSCRTRHGLMFGASGPFLGHFWATWATIGLPLGALGLLLGALGTLFDSPSSPLGSSWAAFGPQEGPQLDSGAILRHSRVHLGSILLASRCRSYGIVVNFTCRSHRPFCNCRSRLGRNY